MVRISSLRMVLMTAAMVINIVAVAESTERKKSNMDACVILLHGMGRTHRSMATMAKQLANKGYRVINQDYPSTQASIETLSQGIVADTVQRCRLESFSTPVHFVTHSLGGILVRQYLQGHRLPPGSRVVMLSPPNQGSEIADLLKDNFLYRWIMGPDRCTGGDHHWRQHPGALVFLPGTGTGRWQGFRRARPVEGDG
jgi:triacylglycerol lipase